MRLKHCRLNLLENSTERELRDLIESRGVKVVLEMRPLVDSDRKPDWIRARVAEIEFFKTLDPPGVVIDSDRVVL
jgi:hypothetical protein